MRAFIIVAVLAALALGTPLAMAEVDRACINKIRSPLVAVGHWYSAGCHGSPDWVNQLPIKYQSCYCYDISNYGTSTHHKKWSAMNFSCLKDNEELEYTTFTDTFTCGMHGDTKVVGKDCRHDEFGNYYTKIINYDCCVDMNAEGCKVDLPGTYDGGDSLLDKLFKNVIFTVAFLVCMFGCALTLIFIIIGSSLGYIRMQRDRRGSLSMHFGTPLIDSDTNIAVGTSIRGYEPLDLANGRGDGEEPAPAYYEQEA